YYTNTAIPHSVSEIYTINYYDNYTFDKVSGNSETSYGKTPTTNVKGLTTGSKVRVLDSNPVKWITSVSYYDDKARPIYVYSHNAYLNTTDKVKSQLDFTGQVLETTATHAKTGKSTITTVDTFTYDHVGRLVSQKQKINSLADELIAENHYDDLGQLTSKGVGGKTTQGRLQTVDYAYNIRGWLKQINNTASLGNDLFGFKINYNTVNHSATKLYNGNISETEWKTANSDTGVKWYKYTYDDLNRLKEAEFMNNDPYYSSYNYDKNGNITSLFRFDSRGSSNIMDDLTYTYDLGNKLMRVGDLGDDSLGFIDDYTGYHLDTTDDYNYDNNGNMTLDTNKGITNITYNHLNLPTNISINGNGNTGTIAYIYDATGVKLEKKVTENGTNTYTYYNGNHVYEGSSLKFFKHSEGYVEPKDANNYALGFNYAYQYKDHLGNVRLSYQDSDNSGSVDSSEILEENNYYPFGLKHKGYNDGGTAFYNPALDYQYNGVEYEESLGLNLYEMDFRSYDPAIGRFNGIDPVTHFSQGTSVAFDNNPIFWADPSGADSWKYDWNSNDGTYVNESGDRTQDYNRAINETQTDLGVKDDCPRCKNKNILIDFVKAAGIEAGKDAANEAIYRHKNYSSEQLDENKYSVELETVEIEGENLNFKKSLGNFIRQYLLIDANHYSFEQNFDIKNKDGSTSTFSANGEIYLKQNREDLDLKYMNYGTYGSDQNGNTLGQISFINSKNELVARLKFQNKKVFNTFIKQNFTNPKIRTRNKLINEYLGNKK
ncbi:RHS repeat-associated core domain-containing protein, partial [Postechiella marina]|uniref:RHS repeat domain-containing protein n=1 Tax=Postechiella marina TaxID=943941 RepID=UPI0031D7F2B1